MGDSDSTAALKRHMAAMEAALSTLTTELSAAQDRIAALEGGSDSALAARVRQHDGAPLAPTSPLKRMNRDSRSASVRDVSGEP